MPLGSDCIRNAAQLSEEREKVPRTLNVSLVPHPGDPDAITSNPHFARPGKAGTDIDLTTMKDLQGYRLKSKSAAIDKGKSIKTAEDPRDFFGAPSKAGVSIWARWSDIQLSCKWLQFLRWFDYNL